MKRSQCIKLFLLTTVCAIALTGCHDEDKEVKNSTDGYYFKDEQECHSTFDDDTCKEAFEQSVQASDDSAPQFDTQDECESHFGENGCKERNSWGNSTFVPFMTGFMISKLTNQHPLCRDNPNDPNCRQYGGGAVYVHPYFYANNGYYFGSAAKTMARTYPAYNSAVLTAPPAPRVSPSFSPSTSAGSVSRGGFGGSAHASGVGE